MFRGRKHIGEMEGQKFPIAPDHFIPKESGIITVYDYNNTGRRQTVIGGMNYSGLEIWNIKDTAGNVFTGDELMLVF